VNVEDVILEYLFMCVWIDYVVVMNVGYWLYLCMNNKTNMPCEVIVCNLRNHGAIGCYDANMLAEIK